MNLQNIKLSKNQNSREKSFSTSVYESSTEVLLFLKNLEILKIPWNKFPTIAQIEILNHARECYICDNSMTEMANKGMVRKYVKRNDIQYDNKDKKKSNNNENNVINNNEDNIIHHKIYEKKIMIISNNKKPLLLSHGLDLLSVISNLGCRWKDITSLSYITANHLIRNSCDIIIKSRTRVSTKSNPTNYEYSVGVIERNNRLLKYGRTFVRTYDYLNTSFEDFDVESEDVVLKSFSIVLEGLINDIIMKGSSHSYEYDYDWDDDKNDHNDIREVMNVHKSIRKYDSRNDNQQRSQAEGLINNYYNNNDNEEKNDIDNGRVDVKNKEILPNSGMSNYNLIHAEFALLEKMEMKSNTDLPITTNTVSNPSFSVDKKQADDDFFTEIENVSKFSKKMKKITVMDKNKISKNIGLNKIKRIPGEIMDKIGVKSTSSTSTSSSPPFSSSSSASTTTEKPSPSSPATASSHSNNDVFDLKNVLSVLQSSGLNWRRMSSKNKIEFSILISELLLKINGFDYYPPLTIPKDLNTSKTQSKAENSNSINSTNLEEIYQKRDEEIQLYIDRNKKYFYFLNVRSLLLSFLNKCGIDKLTVSPQLRNNILLIEEGIRTSLDDILSLQSSHPMIVSLHQFLEKYSKL